ncbi:MAG: XdhC family protein [Gemmatimonadetes bacterium]|nr:XdhC family protein [Gemmatimonadota bacterium]
MNERAALWLAAAEAVEAGRAAAFATVARKRGSLPMASDAKMLVTADGGRWGTVGGGCTEADVTAQALATLETGKPDFVKHTLNADLIGDLALSCGGTVELFVEPLVGPKELARLCRAVGQAIERRLPATVATALAWPNGPSKLAEVGGERWAVGAGERLLSSARPRPTVLAQARPAHRHTAAFVDEEAEAFIEPIRRLPRLTVFGAGHVGAELAQLAARAGFYVIVVDDRAEFANAERVPSANEIVVDDFRTVLDRLTFDEDDYVIAATRGHSFDAYIVERTVGSGAGYVGMLGSKRKRAVIWRALEAAGVDPKALKRVRSPIGVDIGADTPAEIAVSVVAELVRLRRLGEGA